MFSVSSRNPVTIVSSESESECEEYMSYIVSLCGYFLCDGNKNGGGLKFDEELKMEIDIVGWTLDYVSLDPRASEVHVMKYYLLAQFDSCTHFSNFVVGREHNIRAFKR